MVTEKPTSRTRLATEAIAWMTTVSGAGVPSTAPVWFHLEDDDTLTVFSKDPSVRVRNLRSNPHVTVHLDGDGRGGSIVVVNATATILDGDAGADKHDAFVAKYQGFLDRYGWSASWFAEHYPTRISMAVESVRGS